MQQQWSAVDNYLVEALIPNDPVARRFFLHQKAKKIAL